MAGINFRVLRGECFGLLGPNGAGKSSTVKMIYCFSPVTGGEINVLGCDVRRQPRQIKARLGVVAQDNNLDPDLTVLPVLLLAGLIFAALSMAWVGLIPNIDSFNYFFSLVVTPLFLISGVFFPIGDLAPAMRAVAWFSPLYHAVNVVRGLVTGSVGPHLLPDVAWLLVAVLLLVPAALLLMRKILIK